MTELKNELIDKGDVLELLADTVRAYADSVRISLGMSVPSESSKKVCDVLCELMRIIAKMEPKNEKLLQ